MWESKRTEMSALAFIWICSIFMLIRILLKQKKIKWNELWRKETLKAVSNQQGIFIFLICSLWPYESASEGPPAHDLRGCNGLSEFPGSHWSSSSWITIGWRSDLYASFAIFFLGNCPGRWIPLRLRGNCLKITS